MHICNTKRRSKYSWFFTGSSDCLMIKSLQIPQTVPAVTPVCKQHDNT
jgi:hypothetical protein